MPTLNERIAALDTAVNLIHKARKLADIYKGATANPPTVTPSWEGDPDAPVNATNAMKQVLIDTAVAHINAAETQLAIAKQGL